MIMDETKINLDVETQTFRFTPSEPIKHEEAVSIGRGVKSGEFVVIIHENPHATLVIEPKGSVLVHGISRSEVARLAVQELLLSCLLYTSPSPRDGLLSRMPSSA